MKKWLIDQIKAAIIVTLVIIPPGLINTFLQVWLYEH